MNRCWKDSREYILHSFKYLRIYVELPKQLANTDRIHQFVCEFDSIKFRKQRVRFTE